MPFRKFGRIPLPDDRDDDFRIRQMMPKKAVSIPPHKYWDDLRYFGDQKNTPQCVGYAFAHFIEDGPIYSNTGRIPSLQPSLIYFEAQKLDNIKGENYEGTTVRGGAQALRKKFNKISSFRWAKTIEEIVFAVAIEGPVVVGTYWKTGMEDVDRKGFIHNTGRILGGHAYLINGVNTKERFFRIKNSWGRGWGIKGRAKISFNDMEDLMRDDGEVCLAIEKP